MKIHLESDLHLEFSNYDPVAVADVYVCAGDIGVLSQPTQLLEYFKKVKENCDHVIWVLGNHEFYHSVYEEALPKALNLAKEAGVHLLDIALDTQDLEIDGVKFWGTTFWTDLANNDWFVRDSVQRGLNDFYVIEKANGRKFSAQQSYEINAKSRRLINWDADVIITHHCPTMIEHPRFPTNKTTYAFNNTCLEDQISASSVKYWLYGHTHHSAVEEYNGTIVMSNQRGYEDLRRQWIEDTGFIPNQTVVI